MLSYVPGFAQVFFCRNLSCTSCMFLSSFCFSCGQHAQITLFPRVPLQYFWFVITGGGSIVLEVLQRKVAHSSMGTGGYLPVPNSRVWASAGLAWSYETSDSALHSLLVSADSLCSVLDPSLLLLSLAHIGVHFCPGASQQILLSFGGLLL